MALTVNRRTLIARAAAASAVGSAAVAGMATKAAGATLDAQYVSPFAPYPTLAFPGSWYAFTGLTQVSIPSGVYVCDEQLSPITAVSGLPDVRLLPPAVTLLGLFHQWFPSQDAMSAQPLLQLNDGAMQFTDLVGGDPVGGQAGFRNFSNAYELTWQGGLYALQVNLWVGPDAGSEWQVGQQIVDSITVPGAD